MKGQGILPRLNDFPGETGKCRGKFLHMNRPLERLLLSFENSSNASKRHSIHNRFRIAKRSDGSGLTI